MKNGMKPETKINLLIWCGYMLGFVYACFLGYIPDDWKWVVWSVSMAVLVLLMILSDHAAVEYFEKGVDFALMMTRGRRLHGIICDEKGENTNGQQDNG